MFIVILYGFGMIFMELTRIDAVFSRTTVVLFFCAEMKVLQTPRNFLWIFYGPEDYQWARAAPGGRPEGAQPTRARLGPQAQPGGLCPPRWPPVPLLRPINFQIFQKSSGRP